MIRRTLIIAWAEFIKYVTRRGFIISLFMMPVLLAVSIAVPSFTAAHPRSTVMTVVDLAGGYDTAIAAAAARDQHRAELQALAAYAGKYADERRLAQQDPALTKLFAAPSRIASVNEFAARGGWRAAFAVLSPLLKPGAPAFDAPKPAIVLVPPPPDLVADFTGGKSAVALAYLDGTQSVTAAGHSARLSSIVLIPKAFAPGSAREAEYWSNNADQSLQFVRWSLTDAFRLQVNRALVAPELRAKVTLDVDAPVKAIDPSKGKEIAWTDRLAQLVPVGLAFLLFIVAFSDAALLLQGVVEEKSTRMIEVLLSCAGPQEIMTGKLIGVVGLALVTIGGWAVMCLAMALAVSGDALTVIAAGMAALLPMLPLVLLYFLCGLLIYCAIFLGIGATSASLPDAQALMGPATMIIVLPNMLLGAIIQDPNGTLAQVISWIPIYTPFFMLVRLPFHPAPLELWATAILTVITTVLLIRQMGRVFARHVLSTERPPSFASLLRQVVGKAKGKA